MVGGFDSVGIVGPAGNEGLRSPEDDRPSQYRPSNQSERRVTSLTSRLIKTLVTIKPDGHSIGQSVAHDDVILSSSPFPSVQSCYDEPP